MASISSIEKDSIVTIQDCIFGCKTANQMHTKVSLKWFILSKVETGGMQID